MAILSWKLKKQLMTVTAPSTRVPFHEASLTVFRATRLAERSLHIILLGHQLALPDHCPVRESDKLIFAITPHLPTCRLESISY
jgi:hypothetical protein